MLSSRSAAQHQRGRAALDHSPAVCPGCSEAPPSVAPGWGSTQERLSDTRAPRPRSPHAWRCPMDVIYTRCCGLDIHKKTVVACLMTSEEGQPAVKTIRTLSPMTADLLALA